MNKRSTSLGCAVRHISSEHLEKRICHRVQGTCDSATSSRSAFMAYSGQEVHGVFISRVQSFFIALFIDSFICRAERFVGVFSGFMNLLFSFWSRKLSGSCSSLIRELKRVDDLGECLGIFLCLVDYSLPHVVPKVHALHVGCCGDDRVLMGVQENFHLLQRLFRLAAGCLFLAHVYSGSFHGDSCCLKWGPRYLGVAWPRGSVRSTVS